MGSGPNQNDAQQEAARILREMWEDTKRAYAQVPGVHFEQRAVQPPSAVYVTTDEFIALNIFPLAANPALSVRARVLTPEGEIKHHAGTVTGASAGAVTRQIFFLSEGYLLDVCVSAVGSSLQQGQCYVRCDLQHTSVSSATPMVTLCAGYVTNTSTVSFPTQPQQSSVDGAGLIVETTITNPAAGADFTFTVPTNVRVVMISLYGTLTASAAAANRNAYLIIDDGANNVWAGGPPTVQTANQVFNYMAGSGLTGNAIPAGQLLWNLPNGFVLIPGWRISSTVINIQADDQWTLLRLVTRQWLEL